MRISKTSTAVLIAALAAITVLPAAADLLNGDCELGAQGSAVNRYRLTDWYFQQSAGTDGNWTIGAFTWDKHGGEKAGGVHLKNGGAAAPWRHGTYTQTVTGLVPDALYNVKGWVRANTMSQDAFAKLGAKTGGAADYTWSDSNYTDTWTEYTVQVTASGTGEVDVQAYLNNGACQYDLSGGRGPTAMFDDVTVTLVPEPATLALLSLGCLFLRRRRR